MEDNLSELFTRCSAEMEQCGQAQIADLFLPTGINTTLAENGSTVVKAVHQYLLDTSIIPSDCLLAASSAGLFLTHQPANNFSNHQSCNQYLVQHLERREYCIRVAQIDDLPALLLLEEHCWAKELRTPESVLKQRVSRYPEGQLVLVANNVVVGVIYSQCIESEGALTGISVDQVDSLHNLESSTVQLLAVNILPEMQQQNLGDQLLEFMLIYRGLQKAVQSVVAITLCKNFDRHACIAVENYIQQRNAQGVLADPVLRFHELHGAVIKKVMPGYRPGDHKNK
ncbi:MAG: hypothetical protein KAJ63_14830, partial [Methyloprofundus sp.]|nr:hypothetical protein [Methyloprofundus sp.]